MLRGHLHEVSLKWFSTISFICATQLPPSPVLQKRHGDHQGDHKASMHTKIGLIHALTLSVAVAAIHTNKPMIQILHYGQTSSA